MSDFEKWFKDQVFYTNMRFIHGDKLFDKDGDVYRVLPVQMTYQGWNTQRQRSKDEFVALTQEWHTKGWDARQGEIDQLKAQLNNMEQCYIEKKKQAELLESNINNLAKQFSDCYEVAYAEYKKNADSYYSGKCDAFDLAEQLAGLALRGAND